ncbi:MAG: deoxyribonuclease IV [Sedimentisphaerales bacterium]|nr:deoxyribonuclease IV [Sedimentisphaerales bacterium]
MTVDRLILGAHMSAAGGLENALWAAKKHRCSCVQLFVTNQRQWKRTPLENDEAETFIRTRRETNITPAVVHGSYLINLAAPDPTTYKRSLAALADEWQRSQQINADFYVIHPGAHLGKGEKAGLNKIVTSINNVISTTNNCHCRLLLETTAGQGTCLGHRFEQLAEIISRVDRPELLGVCLDTCHIFAAGYDFRTPESFNETIRQFDKTIGLEKLKLIHVNDSKTDLNSRVDRHEHIGKGFIRNRGFRNFLTDPRTRKLPFILETPKGLSPGRRNLDMLNLATLRRLAK